MTPRLLLIELEITRPQPALRFGRLRFLAMAFPKRLRIAVDFAVDTVVPR